MVRARPGRPLANIITYDGRALDCRTFDYIATGVGVRQVLKSAKEGECSFSLHNEHMQLIVLEQGNLNTFAKGFSVFIFIHCHIS